MQDEKLELFFNKELWEDTIQKCVDKRINKGILAQLCETDNRIAFANLLASGEYKIAPPYIGLIPKPNTPEMRKVYINTGLDRLVLSLINDVYLMLYKSHIHSKCVSYQKGLGVSKIVKSISKQLPHLKVEGRQLGYKADLSKYFDRVNKSTLYKALDELDTGSCLDKIVQTYYKEDIILDENKQVVEHYKSLAQGSAVSSFLANYVLRDIDEALSSMDIIYYRYSDDLLIIEKDADKAIIKLKEMLEPKGLELNPKKIEKIYKDEWFTFLGFDLMGDNITLSKDSKQRFKKKIKQITKMRKGMPTGNRRVQRKAIKDINYYIYTAFLKSSQNFGWGEYFYNVCTIEEDIRELDEFVKDHIKHMYTGKWNHTTNMNKTSNEKLKDLGYVSMVHMYKLYRINKEVFRAEIRREMT